MQADKLLDRMYDNLPQFQRKINQRLRGIVDKGASVDNLISFVTEVVGHISGYNKKTCHEASRDFIYRRLGWL